MSLEAEGGDYQHHWGGGLPLIVLPREACPPSAEGTVPCALSLGLDLLTLAGTGCIEALPSRTVLSLHFPASFGKLGRESLCPQGCAWISPTTPPHPAPSTLGT